MILYEGDAKRAVLVLYCGQKVIDEIPTEPRGSVGLFRGGAAIMDGMEHTFAELTGKEISRIEGGLDLDIGVNGRGNTFSPVRNGNAIAQGMTGPTSGTSVVAALATKAADWDELKTHLSTFVELAWEATMWRMWTSAEGKFKSEAKFLKFQDGKVHLQKRDGSDIQAGMNALSKQDQKYVRDYLRKNPR